MPIKTRLTLTVATLLLGFSILFGTTIIDLSHDWLNNDNYSHGFIIPFIVGYMIWQKKDFLNDIPIQSNNWGLLIVIFGMIVFLSGKIGAEYFTMRTAIIITIFGLSVYFLGGKITIAIAVPLAYLMFMVPLPAIIWNKIAFPLQLLAAKMTANVVHLLGIPLLREGNVLHLSNTTLEVVDACSGLRSLTSLLALSAAFAYTTKISISSKWLLFISAIPIAVLVNIVRLTITALLAIYIGPETAQNFLHDLSGFVVFLVALAILYFSYLLILKIESKLSKNQAA